ncbi:MAG: trigger factor [Candidatus Moranbacteria bacterium]|nr:trigger factor [Candidatus Moranbacteria bacterium]
MEIKKLPKSQVEIQISVPTAEFQKFIDGAAEELSKDLKIDGFRPGKAPRNVVEQKVGAEKILAHGAERAIKKTYVDAITKNKLDTIGEPKITITKIAVGNDLEYKAVAAVMPEVKLSSYRKDVKTIKKPEAEKVTEGQIQKEIEAIQKSRAKLVTVARQAKKDDRVEIDFEVFADGKLIEGGAAKNHPLTIGENYFIPGFEDQLVGMKEKDEKEFELAFPKDYHQKELAGKPAKFKVKMSLVQEKELPKIDDEFAKNLGKFENLAAFKKNLAEGIELEQKNKNEEKWRAEAIEKIAAESQIELPDMLVDQELEKMMAEFEQNIAAMGLQLETYLENIKKSKSEIAKGWKETAERRVRAALILKEIAKAEEIGVPSSEVEEEMNRVLAYYKSVPNMEKNVDMERLYSYAKGIISNEKVFKLLESL